jgi:hypothetical protein
VSLGELVVDDGGRAEEEVLERDARRQVPGVDEGDVLVAAVDGVAVVLTTAEDVPPRPAT